MSNRGTVQAVEAGYVILSTDEGPKAVRTPTGLLLKPGDIVALQGSVILGKRRPPSQGTVWAV